MARIMVVDDDEADRLVVETILAQAGHDVLSVGDGETAVDYGRRGGIDLIVTDLQMGAVHGFELISALRGTEPSPAFIAMSGTGDFQLDMAAHLGASVTLQKPVDAASLLDAVEVALGQ